MSRRGKKSYRGVIVQSLLAMPILTILLSLLCAKLIVAETIGEELAEICAFIIAGVVALCVSLNAAIRMPQKKALWGIASAGTYAVVLLLSNLLFFGVEYADTLPIIVTVLAVGTLGSLLGGIKRRKYA